MTGLLGNGLLGLGAGTLAQNFPQNAEQAQTPVPDFTGSTTVTPRMEPQVLPTSGKMLRANIRVLAVKARGTPNSAGGITLTIGG